MADGDEPVLRKPRPIFTSAEPKRQGNWKPASKDKETKKDKKHFPPVVVKWIEE